MKYDKQVKLMAVKRYLRGGVTYRDLAARLGIARSALQRWVAWYQVHGAFRHGKSAEAYSVEFKLSALQHMWDNRLSYGQASVHFKLDDHHLLRRWAFQLRKNGVTALMPALPSPSMSMTIPTTQPEEKKNEQPTYAELLAQNGFLQMENAYLKKLQALVQSQASKASVKKRK